jgi:hypothetical protein
MEVPLSWGVLLFLLGLWSIVATTNALRPFRQEWLLFPSLVWSWLVIALPGQHVFTQMLLAGLLVWLGALEHFTGWIGLLLLFGAWAGIAILIARTRSSRPLVADALDEAGIARFGDAVRAWRILLAFPFRGRQVERISNIEFRRVGGHVLKLNIYRQREPAFGRPVLLYVHGGGWIAGDKREQGIPLMHHLARNGWMCFAASYRLSPGATFPTSSPM